MNDEDLLEIVQKAAGDGSLRLDGPTSRLTGGFWAELIGFRLAGRDGDLVARFMPDAATAAKETAVQAAVAEAGFPTPAVRFAGGPDDGHGRAFLVMDRVAGRPLLADLDGAAVIGRLPTLARTIPDVLASTMAALHGMDPAPVRTRLEEAGVDASSPVAMAERLTAMAKDVDRPDLQAAGSWLLANRPSDSDAVVCHGDLHPLNVLVAEDGRHVVLDWSGSLLAPREYDVAFTTLILSEPPLDVPAPLRPMIRTAGRLLARRFRRRYAEVAGIELDRSSVRWHVDLLCLRNLLEVAGWVATGTVDDHPGHPWLVTGPGLARRLSSAVGSPVRAA